MLAWAGFRGYRMNWPHVRAARKADMTSAAPGRLATEVRDRRTELRLRQDELADLAGVSERFVYALERGKPTVQLDKVLAVLNALGLHLQIHRGASGEIR